MENVVEFSCDERNVFESQSREKETSASLPSSLKVIFHKRKKQLNRKVMSKSGERDSTSSPTQSDDQTELLALQEKEK